MKTLPIIAAVLIPGVVYSDLGLSQDITNLNIILTPARLKQAIEDSPASITVIDSARLDELNIKDIPEALSLVPGIIVWPTAGNDYRLEYHGTNAVHPRRTQILIDGVSWYRVGRATIDWATLPISIEEVERIEVTRSPSTASYGANSFTSVINIITKDPEDVANGTLKVLGGSVNTQNAYARLRHSSGKFRGYLSAYRRKDDGYDTNIAATEKRHDSTQIERLNMAGIYEVGDIFKLRTTGSISNGYIEEEYGDDDQVSFPDRDKRDAHIAFKVESLITPYNKLDVQVYSTKTSEIKEWRTCIPTFLALDELSVMYDANPEYALQIINGQIPEGGSTQDDLLAAQVLDRIASMGDSAFSKSCGTINDSIDEDRYDIEIQDTITFGNKVRALLGVNIRREYAYSQTFFGGKREDIEYRLFANTELKPWEKWVVNAGAMLETTRKYANKKHISPRVSLNYKVNSNYTLRAVYSTAIRKPDLLAADRSWNYLATDIDPPFFGETEQAIFFTARSDNPLKYERIESTELSLYTSNPQIGLRSDIKLFNESRYDLISERLNFFDYNPTNDSYVYLRGVELQTEWYISQRWLSYMAASYITNESNHPLDVSLHSDFIGSLALRYQPTRSWNISTMFYWINDVGDYDYYKAKLNISKAFSVWGTKLELDLDTVLQSQEIGITRGEGSAYYTSAFNDGIHFFGTVRWQI